MLDSYNIWITDKNWGHLTFLRYLLLMIVLLLLFFVGWILLLVNTGFFSPEFLSIALRQIGLGVAGGSLVGLIIGFFLLLPGYIAEEWDLHEIVPLFLIRLLFVTILSFGLALYMDLNPLLEQGGVIGIIIGGLLGITAYAGEVEREHSPEAELDDS